MHDAVDALTPVDLVESRRAPQHLGLHRLTLVIGGLLAARPSPKGATRAGRLRPTPIVFLAGTGG